MISLCIISNPIISYSAYSTLISAESRKEYDEYIESYQGLSNMYGDHQKY